MTMRAHWLVLGTWLAACTDPLGAVLPQCRTNAECPTGYRCESAVCTAGAPLSASASMGGAATSASSTAASSTSSLSSSAGVSSSAGPFCAQYSNITAELALPFQVQQQFNASICRDQLTNVHYWSARGVGLRAGSRLTLNLQRGLNDGGVPAHQVGFSLAVGQGADARDLYFSGCNNGMQASETCAGTPQEFVPDVFIKGQALDAMEMPYVHESALTLVVAGACATPPTNTTPENAAYFFFGGANGAVCHAGTTYLWRFPCLAGNLACSVEVVPLDRAQSRTPLEVLVDVPTDAGFVTTRCDAFDGGYLCPPTPAAGADQFVRVRADVDGGTDTLPVSEFLGLRGF